MGIVDENLVTMQSEVVETGLVVQEALQVDQAATKQQPLMRMILINEQ